MKLEKAHIYRMTHIDNIPHVLKFGITHKNSSNSNPNFIPIGDSSLIGARESKSVRVDNGSIYGSFKNIILGNFIPFYFGLRMPMLYVMQNGGNFVEKATQPENIVYLACKIINVVNSDIEYYFSDGHATNSFTSFYDSSKIQELSTIINWNAIKAQFWSGDDNLNIKRKKQAEFLVANDIPFEFVNALGCYNEKAKAKLISIGVDEQIINITQQSYY